MSINKFKVGKFVGYDLKELSRYNIDTFADVIYRNALLVPNNIAFIYNNERVTFAQYNERVNRLINALHGLGARKGDVIGILSWNCAEFTYIIGASMKAGFITSPFNPRLGLNDLEYLINYATAKFIFAGGEFIESVKQLGNKIPGVKHVISMEKPAAGALYIQDLIDKYSGNESDVEVTEQDPVLILYTSGTTGKPKGALYTQGKIIENAKINMSAIPINASEKTILALQLFHIAAMEYLQNFLFAGGCSILLKSFEPDLVMQAIQDEKANVIAMVPTVLAAILALPDLEKYDHSSLSRISYLGSPMPVALLKQGIEKFGFVFFQHYGLTESGPLVTTLTQTEHKVAYGSAEDQKILKSCGHAVRGVHIRIIDEQGKDVKTGESGELVIRSKAIMREYWHKPKETAETIIDNWFHTRDIGYADDKGYMYIISRKQDMIITGGEHVYPREVEEVLYQYPAVLEAAVIGVPDQYWVERVHAFVTVKQGMSCTPEEIVDYCKRYMPRFKAPKSCEIISEMPKSAAGKILKTELRKAYAEKSEAH